MARKSGVTRWEAIRPRTVRRSLAQAHHDQVPAKANDLPGTRAGVAQQETPERKTTAALQKERSCIRPTPMRTFRRSMTFTFRSRVAIELRNDSAWRF